MKTVNNNKMTGLNITERAEMIKERNTQGLYGAEGAINKELIEGNVMCDKIIRKSTAFAAMSYSYGNLVGLTTVGVSAGLTLLSNPKQYFIDGVLSENKIKKVIKNFGTKKIEGKKYTSVFPVNVNRVSVINKFNRVAEIVRVSSVEVKEFESRLKELDYAVTTASDLEVIAKDLDIIGRAMQELAIDVTKDKSKDIGIDIKSIINIKTDATSRLIKKGMFTNNIDEIVSEYNNSDKITKEYKIELSNKRVLNEVKATNLNDLAIAAIEDTAGDIMEEINAGYTEGFKDLIDLYKCTNNNMYDIYECVLRQAMTGKDKALTHMVKCARVAMYSINSLYKIKDGTKVNSTYIKEVGAKLRAGLYTEGAKFNYEPKTVVKIAIAASFCHLKNDGSILKKKNPSLTEVWAIFPKEFVLSYINNGNETVKDLLTVTSATYDLCLNDELEFDAGVAMTEYGFVSVREEYTGKAIVTEDGLEAVVNHYAYEPTSIVFIEKTYKRNVGLVDAPYQRPVDGLEVSDDSYSYEITDIIKKSEAAEIVPYNNGANADLIVYKGDKRSTIGTVLSKKNNITEVEDAIATCNGTVIFYK